MPEVIADPDKLRRLAKTLLSSADQFEQSLRQLRRSLDGTGWRDSERQRFEADFAETLKSVSVLIDALKNNYAAQLERKAEALDRFAS